MAPSYECKFCDAAFSKPRILHQHVRLVHKKEPFHCKICQKPFGRKDNLRRHMLRHVGNSHECDTCGKVFNCPDSLQRHFEQHGGAQRVEIMEVADKKFDPKDVYEIKKVKERNIARFKTTAQDYKVTFKDIQVEGLPNILSALRQVFTAIFSEITSTMGSQDLVQINVQCPELDYPIVLPFRRQEDITADYFLSEVERVLQSYEQFVLDSTLEIQVTHVAIASGSGKPRICINLDKFLQEKKCIIRIQNKDDLCCARAIVTAKGKIDNDERWNSIRQGRNIQKQLAEELHQRASVPKGKCSIEEIKQFQTVLEGYQLYVISKDYFNAIIYTGPEAEKKIYLYHHDNHYDIITSVPAFLNKSYFCQKCYKGYDHRQKHKCNSICGCCFKEHESDGKDQWLHCTKCNRFFKGQNCYDNHTKTTIKGNSTCRQYFRCSQCSKVINKQERGDTYRCGEIFCKTCREYVSQDHKCFMKPTSKKLEPAVNQESNQMVTDSKVCDSEKADEEEERKTYIFFDFECTQDTGVHKPNLCVAHKVCELCLDQEQGDCNNCGRRERIFSGETTQIDFCKWLFSGENSGAVCMCHNFKGYDSYFILQYLYDNAVLPKVILTGTKVMCISVPNCHMKFIDSMNFLPMALRKLPATFNITELCKGYYPHLYNTKQNQDKTLSHLPDPRYYHPNGMSPKERAKFFTWYEKNKHKPFDVKSELLRYCQADVDILRRSCLRFRDLFMSMTSSGEGDPGIDPFESCITIASACNLVFRSKFLKGDTIAIIPPHGYRPQQKQSVKALQWIKYISYVENVKIRHALNNKEFRVGNYPVDGYYESSSGQRIILQFEGCFWHGCVRCYSRNTVNPVSQLTMDELYQRTMDKKHIMEDLGFVYIQKWECDWDKEVKLNCNLQQFIEQLDIVEPLEPRHSFFGGRTETFKLFKDIEPNTKIKYKDVTSLYPHVNRASKYPIGHPEVVTENFQSLDTYEGLVKCKILPPRQLYLPVLPAKINGKLVFALCQTCAETRQTNCHHEEDQRAMTGTWVTDEIKAAVRKGYVVLKVYEVWHFKETDQYDPIKKSGGLFTSYINTCLKIKQQASGWPNWCISPEQKKQYIDRYYDREGIQLEWNKIEKNPGLRAIGKLMANNFWGKLSQRSNLPQTSHVTDPFIYFDMLTSDKQDVKHVRFVNEEMVEVQWQNKTEFVEPSARTNVVLASYTTAHARLKLLDLLETLGDDVLYADTDSVIYIEKDGEDKLPTGDFIGELTDELSGNHIVSFASTGPKSYSFKLDKPDIDGNLTLCKVKGITLNYKNSLDINFETLTQMVKGSGPETVTVTDTNCIRRDKSNTNIVSKQISKDYRVVFDKRVIIDGYDTLPYGY